MDKKLVFNNLAENAMDFLEKSVNQVNQELKYSIINAYTAIELFLKARILQEHWTLIVKRNSNYPNKKAFLDGNFSSVGLDESNNILQNVCGCGFDTKGKAFQSFQTLRQHRNKAVHFYHGEINTETSAELIKAELNSIYYLYKTLMSESWCESFSEFSERILELHRKLKREAPFLEAIYNDVKPEIERLAEHNHVEECPICGYSSFVWRKGTNEIIYGECEVCQYNEPRITIECNCGNNLIFKNDPCIVCDRCQEEYTPDKLIDLARTHNLLDEDMFDSNYLDFGNCSECDGYHTVRLLNDGLYMCFSCLNSFDHLSLCECCQELNTGNMDYSYVNGCNFCEGVDLD